MVLASQARIGESHKMKCNSKIRYGIRLLSVMTIGLAAMASTAASGTESAVSPVRGIDRDARATRPSASIDTTRAAAEYRTIDGRGNNVAQPDFGSAGTALLRLSPAAYADGIAAVGGQTAPNPRTLSNQLSDQLLNRANPSAASSFLWQWGQFVDHDIDLTDGVNPPESANIPVPTGDAYFDPDATGNAEISFNRSIYDPASGTGMDNPRQQINEITAWIDGSNIYGSDAARAMALRQLDGSGRLKTGEDGLLPFNVDALPNAGGSGAHLFVAGDVRANEQVGLTALHTLFVREHNRLATTIALAHPEYDGETLYQEARRLVVAQLQAVTYQEFLPLLLGPDALPPYTGYRPEIDPGIANEFSTAAFRLGHSMLSPVLLRLDASGAPLNAGHLDLRDAFFAPQRITGEGGIEPLLRGLAAQFAQRIDTQIIDDVRNFLFGLPGAGGFDLVSLNVHRGRDHGLSSYNVVRTALGLPSAPDFDSICSDPDTHARLVAGYASADDVELWVGVLAEDHMPGAMVGELAATIIARQFQNLRDGDRFWYELTLSADELAEIQATRLSDIIRRNTAIGDELPDDVFRVHNLPDSDGDGIEDVWDNCSAAANINQRDSNGDGYGNVCDADFDNNGVVNLSDLALFKQVLFSSDEDADLNGDGNVNFGDLLILKKQFFGVPGPSGMQF